MFENVNDKKCGHIGECVSAGSNNVSPSQDD